MTKTITSTIQKRIAIGVMAIAMLFGMMAPSVQAQTSPSDLEAMIANLLAQIAALESQISGGSSAVVESDEVTIGSRVVTTDRLRVRMSYVAGASIIGVVPQGAMGVVKEGPVKRGNHMWWWVDYDNGVRGWSAGTWLSKVAPTEEEDEEFIVNDSLLDITMEVSPYENEMPMKLRAGESHSGVLDIELKASEHDYTITQMMIGFENKSGDNRLEPFPWHTFDEVSIWVDGDKEMTVGTNSKGDWPFYGGERGSAYFLPVSGLDISLAAGESMHIVVAVTTDVDGEGEEWKMTASDIRFERDNSDTIVAFGSRAIIPFELVDEYKSAALRIYNAPSNPDALVLQVEEDDEKSAAYEVLVFKMEEKNDVDVEIEDMSFVVTTKGETDESKVVDEIILYQGSDELSSESVPDGGVVDFENLDIYIDGDSAEEFTIALVLNGSEEYGNDTSVSVAFKEITDAEDNNGNDEADIDVDGSAASETHILRNSIPDVYDFGFDVSKNAAGDSGSISFEFTIEAGDEDYTLSIADKNDVDGKRDDVRFVITGTDSSIAKTSITKVSGDADSTTRGWVIAEGEEATFVLKTQLTTKNAADNGDYRVSVASVAGVLVDETSARMTLVNAAGVTTNDDENTEEVDSTNDDEDAAPVDKDPVVVDTTPDAAVSSVNLQTMEVTGTARNTNSISLVIRDDQEKIAYRALTVPVRNGQWSHTVSKGLDQGTYVANVKADVKVVDKYYFIVDRATPAVQGASMSRPEAQLLDALGELKGVLLKI